MVDEFALLFLVLLNEIRMLGKSSALPFLFLVLIRGMGAVYLEVATGGVPQKKMFLKISQYLQQNTCVGAFFDKVLGSVKMRLHH